jgi:2,3-bisphosphoglycerate-independent phosphoglycerate mutase
MPHSNKTLLVITDGIGHNPNQEFNAFYAAKTPTYDKLFQSVPYSLIRTSGLAVGLPDGQMGNSEVGHMTIGAGRILYQNLVKISRSLKDGSLAKNPKLLELFSKTNRIHVIGLLSDGGVHSHQDHFEGIASLAKNAGKEVFLHPITDGRDVSPSSGAGFIQRLLDADVGNIGSICGRFYAMDRDNRWERVEAAYHTFVQGQSPSSLSPVEYMLQMYSENISDEFIEPASFDGYEGMKPNDGVIFINFRNDRMRQLVRAFGDESFDGFKRDFLPLEILTMTRYDANFPYPVMFESTLPDPTLSRIISKASLRQFHTAETEKYAHVTFFFNGGIETPEPNETRVLIPSPKVATYDAKPQMSAPEVGRATCKALEEGYDFVIVNFANGDMVGHTGNFDAAVKAVEAVDLELGKVLECAKNYGYNVIITSDHGNCEAMRAVDGGRLTNHTVFDVYCFVIAPDVTSVSEGGLSNIAPTVLKLMDLPIPDQMDKPLI